MFIAIANSKNVLTFAFLLIAFCCFYNTAYSQSVVTQAGVTRVVVDAGHGGLDPGAIGRISQEKNINLAVALLLGKMITDSLPGVEVIYTRKTDIFVPLDKRSDIANKSKAQLFISIHTNSVSRKNTAPNGTETFVMGPAKSGANMEVAKRENAVITYEDDYTSKYEGYDPRSPESVIMFSMLQNAYLDQSLHLADRIQKAFGNAPLKTNRGVKQDLFLVLWRTAMPSVLVELGFITNPADEKILSSKQGQAKMAQAIFTAFKSYKTHYERLDQLSKIEQPDKTDNAANPSQTSYHVQIKASISRISTKSAIFSGFQDINCFSHNNIYKYTVGKFNSLDEAQEYCTKVVRKKAKDAFVICVENGKVVPLKK